MRNTSVRILLLALAISLLGILSIYSSTHARESDQFQSLAQRQMVWICLGLVVFNYVSKVNYRRLWDWTYVLYGLTVFLLLLVFVLGIIRMGAQRWLRLAWFNLQPSEIAKVCMVIFLAKYFSLKTVDDVSLKASTFGAWRALIKPFLFVIVPVFLIIEQPDLGSGAIVFMIFFCMLYLSKVKLRYIVIFLCLLALFVPLSWNLLRDYQRERIMVFLNPNIDPLGAGYTVIQSKIAIGSGGFFGKGWMAGTQSQLYFLPESHTDFIFATFTEERGLLGAVVLLSLYFALVWQGISIAMRTADYFGRLLAMGISLMLAIQVWINIAMNMGLAPVVGLPLPLMSYGGSSVIITFMALGILANINKTRAVF